MAKVFPRPPDPITVLIADDHHLLRRGICAELEMFPDRIEIVGEAKNADETLQKSLELVPDLVLLDLRMPRTAGTVDEWQHGIWAIEQLTKQVPHTRVLVISMYDDADIFFRALQAGARGYIAKRTPYNGDDLVQAMSRIMAGEAIYGPNVAPFMRDYHRSRPESSTPLTGREWEVLDLVSAGKTNQEIAQMLSISLGTVKTHVSNVLRKMQVKRREQLQRGEREDPPV